MGRQHVAADPRERRINEHTIGHEPAHLGTVPASQVVPDDAKVVERDVGELRAAGALADGPRVGRGGLEPLIHANVAAVGQFDPVLFETDASRVRRAARRNQDVGTLEIFLRAAAIGGLAAVLLWHPDLTSRGTFTSKRRAGLVRAPDSE